MKQIVYILTSLLLCSAFNANARSIMDFFVSEQGELLSLLPKNTRMDMIDYYNAGRVIEAKNNLGEGTRFNKVTDNYISLQLTKSCTVEMMLIPVSKKDSVIIAIKTLELPAKDSEITFYDTSWQPLATKRYFKPVSMKDFIRIPKGDKTKKETVLEAIDFPIVSYTINPDKATIIARHGLSEYMSKEDYKKIKPYLQDSINYTLQGHTFKPQR